MNGVSFDSALVFFEERDPSLFALAKKLQSPVEPSAGDPEKFFHSLCHSIISQQLSTRVADVIQERFDTLIGGVVAPKNILAVEDQALRDIGLSWAKIKYAKDLASKVQSGEVVMEALAEMSDAEVIESLTKVKGIGYWPVDSRDVFDFYVRTSRCVFCGGLGVETDSDRALWRRGYQKL
jgi:3-methyladenine DNA glycosylase/8-oxoguanine DNA glycosylase